MKKVYLFLTFCILYLKTFAQLSVSSDSMIAYGEVNDFEIISEIILKNNSSDSSVIWTRLEANLPGKWQNAVCDNEKCWFPEKSNHTMKLTIGDSTKFSIYFAPDGKINGTGEVLLSFKALNNPTDSLIVKFYGSTLDPLGLAKEDFVSFGIYPTLVTDNLLFTNDRALNYQVFDANGKEQNLSRNEKVIYFNHLPQGVYLIRHKNGSVQRIFKE